MSEASESSLAPAVTRAVRILTLLADSHGVPQPLSDIARALGAAKSSTSNVCTVLEESGLIQRRDNGYVLGRRNVELGGAYLRTFDQFREFYRICAESPVLGHELVQLAILDGTDVLYLARHEGRAPLRLSAGIGDRFPASLTAIGNALLSELPTEEVAARYAGAPEFPRLTNRSTRTLADLQAKLEATRLRGYALDEGEVFPNVVGIALSVPPRHSGEQPLAIGVSIIAAATVAELPTERRETVVGALRDAVFHLSNPMSPSALPRPQAGDRASVQ
jgi:DNA-binding IclR family transcriptional regulator